MEGGGRRAQAAAGGAVREARGQQLLYSRRVCLAEGRRFRGRGTARREGHRGDHRSDAVRPAGPGATLEPARGARGETSRHLGTRGGLGRRVHGPGRRAARMPRRGAAWRAAAQRHARARAEARAAPGRVFSVGLATFDRDFLKNFEYKCTKW
jgi:hypothetical protein